MAHKKFKCACGHTTRVEGPDVKKIVKPSKKGGYKIKSSYNPTGR
jgi:hypothetical protein